MCWSIYWGLFCLLRNLDWIYKKEKMMNNDMNLHVGEAVFKEINKRTIDYITYSEKIVDYSDSILSSFVLNRDLNRYYGLLKYSLNNVFKLFDSEEIKILLDSVFSKLYVPHSKATDYQGILSHIVEDRMQFEEIDQSIGSNLLNKLNELAFLEELALCDFIELYWIQNIGHPLEDILAYYLA